MYCLAPRFVFTEASSTETDWNWARSSIHRFMGGKKSCFCFLFLTFSPLVTCGMSQGCLIMSDLHIRPKLYYISYFFLFSWASTHRRFYWHSLAFTFLLPAHFRTVSGSYNFLSFEPWSLCLLYIRYMIVPTVEGSCTCSHRRCFSIYAQAFSITCNIFELRVGRNGRSLKDSLGKPLSSPPGDILSLIIFINIGITVGTDPSTEKDGLLA